MNRRKFIPETFEEAERRLLFDTLDHFGWDKVTAAQSLGVSLKTIYNRIAYYNSQPQPKQQT